MFPETSNRVRMRIIRAETAFRSKARRKETFKDAEIPHEHTGDPNRFGFVARFGRLPVWKMAV
jgi:hypothetical protein